MRRSFLTFIAACTSLVASTASAQQAQEQATQLNLLPTDQQYAYVKLETNMGDIIIELNNEKAPISTSNFVQYVNDGFYNGTIFHRVMNNFMIQAGGFVAGEEGPVYKQPRDPITNEWQNGLKNMRGTLAMARLGRQANSATSQFFINVKDNPFLDQPRDGSGYAVFGSVIGGMDVVDKIRVTPVGNATGKRGESPLPMKNVPVDPVMINNATVIDEATISDLIATARAAEEEAKKAEEARKAAEAERLANIGNIDRAVEWLVENHQVNPAEIVTHDSGMRSVVVQAGDGDATPLPTDTVEVHYTGWLNDGTKFDSSRDRGQPTSFPLNRVISGWTEGVGYMTTGERRFLIIPAELGYGLRGSPPTIPGGAVLVFDVELLSIK